MTKRCFERNRFAPWVLVAEGFHQRGGMEKANAALAMYLSSCGVPVHLVAYLVDPELSMQPGVQVTRAAKPYGSALLGRSHLSRLGRAVARRLTHQNPATRVVVNGICCDWPDINWVHWVHQCWRSGDAQAPLWFKAKHRADAWLAMRAERNMLRRTRLLIANSERTRNDLIALNGIDPERVHTIYLGTDSTWKGLTPERRAAARAWLEIPEQRPLVAFVGAFGHDSRKGFETLWQAWKSLCVLAHWKADLIVAGGGRAARRWQSEVSRAGLGGRVRFLGFTERVPELLAAADLLVSPARYESYGLNVQEALCFGIPAIVSSSAGVAERYPAETSEMLLPDAVDSDDLAARMLKWSSDMAGWKQRVEPLTSRLRAYTWEEMARRMVDLAERVKMVSTARDTIAASGTTAQLSRHPLAGR